VYNTRKPVVCIGVADPNQRNRNRADAAAPTVSELARRRKAQSYLTTMAGDNSLILGQARMDVVEIEDRVIRRYELTDEEGRLWKAGLGDLVRLRTWDIFERFLPPEGRILDIGGGPGAHAAHLAERGYQVVLIDPVDKHIELAKARADSSSEWTFEAKLGEARHLPFEDESCDVVLLMGPLYHLVDSDDRQRALLEARRVLRTGGTILAEIITRHAWVLDASMAGLLDEPGIFEDFLVNINRGLSQDPAKFTEGEFWAYLHRPEEFRAELSDAGFNDVELIAVEGFGWLLDDLEQRMTAPGSLMRAIRLTEAESSMIGCSAHVIGLAVRN
jgi:ubiquinone/menaquinone biosynthesis C-methylase UbiE